MRAPGRQSNRQAKRHRTEQRRAGERRQSRRRLDLRMAMLRILAGRRPRLTLAKTLDEPVDDVGIGCGHGVAQIR